MSVSVITHSSLYSALAKVYIILEGCPDVDQLPYLVH